MIQLYAAVALLFFFQLLDWYSTRTILKAKGSELNPVAKAIMDVAGIDGYLAGKVVVVTALGYFIGTYNVWVLWGCCVFYGGVVTYNWQSIK